MNDRDDTNFDKTAAVLEWFRYSHPYAQGQTLGHAWNGTGSINCAHAEVLFCFQIT